MVHKKFHKSVRVQYVLNGVPQEIDIACDEISEKLHYEELCNFVKDDLWSSHMFSND